jgi:hypothetical protein
MKTCLLEATLSLHVYFFNFQHKRGFKKVSVDEEIRGQGKKKNISASVIVFTQ